ncbi:MAG: hypothetical protein IIU54_01995, partial [Phascolarctobacterium sp.]|nr:hypothetical protein [Phascolarctobacterium sp.]
MIIVFKPSATQEAKLRIRAKLENVGFQIHESNGLNVTLYGIVGDTSAFDMRTLISDDSIEKIMRVQEPFKRANRMFHPEDSIVNVAGIPIGGRKLQVIAGPCSVESVEQVTSVAKSVKLGGASMLRGGAFKPRTSPYSFQGNLVGSSLTRPFSSTYLPFSSKTIAIVCFLLKCGAVYQHFIK